MCCKGGGAWTLAIFIVSWIVNEPSLVDLFTCVLFATRLGSPITHTRGDQKVSGKVLLNRIAFINCNENS